MVRPGGPTEAGGFEQYILDSQGEGEGYTVRLYPDLNNEKLQREGQPPVFYWTPQALRLAKYPDTGKFKFSHVHFRGILDETTVGVDEKTETVGGLLNFTVTSRLPPAVMARMKEQIIEERRGDTRPFWRVFGNRDPDITMVPIRGNTAAISSLAPNTPASHGDADAVSTEEPGASVERALITERGIRHDQQLRAATSLDLWAVQLDGTGPGSVTGGENAYGGLLGGIPSELIWSAMRGNASPFFVSQTLLIPMATPVVELNIRGHWSKIFDHFSMAAQASYLFASADISYEMEKLTRKGDIEVEMIVDTTIPGAKEVAERLEKTKDLVREPFMKLAMKTIFEPVPPVEAAKAPKKKGWWSFGASFKLVKKREFLDLRYSEKQTWKYNLEDTIQSNLEGLRREIAADPEEAQHYFHLISLGDLNRKVKRIVHPVANWVTDPSREWAGDPINGIAVEFGYPNTSGELYWKGEQFAAAGGDNQVWEPEWVQLRDEEIKEEDRPPDWTFGQTFVKRRVFLKEGTSALEDPYNRVIVEVNQVDLDPEPNGSLVSDISVDARADDSGVLEVGPIQLGVVLDGNTQVVEVEIQPSGKTLKTETREPQDREVVRFSFDGTDQNEPRRLKIYTGDPSYSPAYQYRVRVIVKGTLFTDGMEWAGDWQPGQGNGPLTVSVPRPGGEGVSEPRALSRDEILSLPSDGNGRFEAGERSVKTAASARGWPGGASQEGPEDGGGGSETVDGYDLTKPAHPPPPEVTEHHA